MSGVDRSARSNNVRPADGMADDRRAQGGGTAPNYHTKRVYRSPLAASLRVAIYCEQLHGTLSDRAFHEPCRRKPTAALQSTHHPPGPPQSSLIVILSLIPVLDP